MGSFPFVPPPPPPRLSEPTLFAPPGALAIISHGD